MSGTICLAVFRPDRELLRSQIESIRSQSLQDWHCTIGVDGPDPSARETLDALIGEDSRFRVIEYADNVGFYRNFERLLEEVDHDSTWVALADQDDYWYPEKLQVLVPLLDRVDLAFGQAIVRAARQDSSHGGNPATTNRRSTTVSAAMIDNQVTGSISVFRRELLDRALPLPHATDSAFHDHWLGLCALVGRGIAVLGTPVQDYVQHGRNVIGEEQSRTFSARLEALASKSKGGGVRAGLDYVSIHRWGWRVSMAVALLARDPELLKDDRRFIEAVAQDRLTLPLLAGTAKEILARRVPPLRAFALLAGAWRSPRVSSMDARPRFGDSRGSTDDAPGARHR